MKCVKWPNGQVDRLPNAEAEALTKSGKAIYVPKSTWKRTVRSKS